MARRQPFGAGLVDIPPSHCDHLVDIVDVRNRGPERTEQCGDTTGVARSERRPGPVEARVQERLDHHDAPTRFVHAIELAQKIVSCVRSIVRQRPQQVRQQPSRRPFVCFEVPRRTGDGFDRRAGVDA